MALDGDAMGTAVVAAMDAARDALPPGSPVLDVRAAVLAALGSAIGDYVTANGVATVSDPGGGLVLTGPGVVLGLWQLPPGGIGAALDAARADAVSLHPLASDPLQRPTLWRKVCGALVAHMKASAVGLANIIGPVGGVPGGAGNVSASSPWSGSTLGAAIMAALDAVPGPASPAMTTAIWTAIGVTVCQHFSGGTTWTVTSTTWANPAAPFSVTLDPDPIGVAPGSTLFLDTPAGSFAVTVASVAGPVVNVGAASGVQAAPTSAFRPNALIVGTAPAGLGAVVLPAVAATSIA